MTKVKIEGAAGFTYHYPRLVVILTAHADDRDNAMAVAWHSSISLKPPLYGVSITRGRFTYELILKSEEFGVNFLGFEAAELMASVGGSKGREINKFDRFHIATEKPLKTSVPILKDAYACYECKLVDHKTYGDHVWVVGEVVAVHFSEEGFTKEGRLDLARVDPALYLGGELYLTTLKETRHLDRKVYGRR